ncbi:MAG: DUF2079 domain-containing protein [Elusimicrobiota bacterium]
MPNLYRAGVLEWIWLGAGLACLAAAAWALAGRRFPSERRGAAWAAWGAGVPVLFVYFKLSQFRAYESMLDSAVMVNLAWNAAHGHGLTSSLLGGVSYWSVHFAFAYALLSPMILIWPSATPFFVLHGLALGSVPLCAYLLARGRGGRDGLGWLAAALAVGHPFVCGILGTVLDNSSFALPLFLWAAYCWESERRMTAAVLALLMLSTRETIPFLFAGVGAVAWMKALDRRGRMRAGGLIAASAVLWLFELHVIEGAKAASGVVFDYWALYPSLGGARGAVVGNLWRRPWLIPAALVWPPLKVWHAAKLFLSLALLPLASGAALLPLLAVWLPQQLGDVSSNFHLLVGHQASYVAGPAIWAAIVGLRRLDARLDAGGRRRLAAWVLAVAGCGFFTTAQFRLPPGALPSSWERSGPRALAAVPAGDAVWSDYFFATHLAARRFIKVLPLGEEPAFDSGRFEPDSVLMSRHWLARAAPAVSARVLTAIKARGLVPIFDEGDLVVFSSPKTH